MIELRSVHKRYRVKESDVVALKEIDLAIESGEIVGIIGPNGAGKSTLLRMINFLERPSHGTVLVDGVDLQGLDDAALRRFRQTVGMIFQHFILVGSKTVGDKVAFPLKIAKHSSAMPIIRWLGTMRVQMWVAYSNRPICFSSGAAHGRCYASVPLMRTCVQGGPTRSHSKQGGPGFAGQVLEFNVCRADRWITGPTRVPQQTGGPGFRCQVLDFWRARQESNPRPPGS